MNRRLALALSLAAGFLGGFASRYISPESVHAQTQAPPPVITSQRFVLVNQAGNPAGLFGFDQDGNPEVVLLDKTGKVAWSTAGKPTSKPLNVNATK